MNWGYRRSPHVAVALSLSAVSLHERSLLHLWYGFQGSPPLLSTHLGNVSSCPQKAQHPCCGQWLLPHATSLTALPSHPWMRMETVEGRSESSSIAGAGIQVVLALVTALQHVHALAFRDAQVDQWVEAPSLGSPHMSSPLTCHLMILTASPKPRTVSS